MGWTLLNLVTIQCKCEPPDRLSGTWRHTALHWLVYTYATDEDVYLWNDPVKIKEGRWNWVIFITAGHVEFGKRIHYKLYKFCKQFSNSYCTCINIQNYSCLINQCWKFILRKKIVQRWVNYITPRLRCLPATAIQKEIIFVITHKSHRKKKNMEHLQITYKMMCLQLRCRVYC
jgi:hypothetical protein